MRDGKFKLLSNHGGITPKFKILGKEIRYLTRSGGINIRFPPNYLPLEGLVNELIILNRTIKEDRVNVIYNHFLKFYIPAIVESFLYTLSFVNKEFSRSYYVQSVRTIMLRGTKFRFL